MSLACVEPQGGGHVSAALHKKIKHYALVIDGAPKTTALTLDAADHFIKTPARRWIPPASLRDGGDPWAKFLRPDAEDLAGQIDTPSGEHFLDVAQAQSEAK